MWPLCATFIWDVVWFKCDLRIRDHQPLSSALLAGSKVLLLHLFEPGRSSLVLKSVPTGRQVECIAVGFEPEFVHDVDGVRFAAIEDLAGLHQPIMQIVRSRFAFIFPTSLVVPERQASAFSRSASDSKMMRMANTSYTSTQPHRSARDLLNFTARCCPR